MGLGFNKTQLKIIRECINNLDNETLRDNAYIITCLEAVKYCGGNVPVLLDYYLDHKELLYQEGLNND